MFPLSLPRSYPPSMWAEYLMTRDHCDLVHSCSFTLDCLTKIDFLVHLKHDQPVWPVDHLHQRRFLQANLCHTVCNLQLEGLHKVLPTANITWLPNMVHFAQPSWYTFHSFLSVEAKLAPLRCGPWPLSVQVCHFFCQGRVILGWWALPPCLLIKIIAKEDSVLGTLHDSKIVLQDYLLVLDLCMANMEWVDFHALSNH